MQEQFEASFGKSCRARCLGGWRPRLLVSLWDRRWGLPAGLESARLPGYPQKGPLCPQVGKNGLMYSCDG